MVRPRRIKTTNSDFVSSGSAHAAPDGNADVLRFPARERLEHQVVALQHVGVHRGVRRAEAADFFAGEAQQVGAGRVVQMRGAQRAHDRAGRGHAGISIGGAMLTEAGRVAGGGRSS